MLRVVKKWTVVIMMAALVLAVVSCSSESTKAPQPTTEVAPKVGALAPDFTLNTLEGEDFTLSENVGNPMLISFWATWCGYCRYQMPFLEEVHREKAGQGLLVVGIDYGEDKETVRRYVKGLDLTFIILLDEQLEVVRKYGAYAVPISFLVDRKGVIRFIKVGAFISKEEMQKALKMIM